MSGEEQKIMKTGTTTLGIKVKDAIVLAADTQMTYGNAMYVDEITKIEKINSTIGLTIAGSVGDNQALVRFLKQQAVAYEIERDRPMTVKAAVSLTANILHSNKYYPLMVSFIMGGFNHSPHLYTVEWNGSALENNHYVITGSGFEFGLSVLDQFYKPDMTEDEAIELGLKTIAAAKKRDIYTGGVNTTIAVIDKNGFRQLSPEDIEKVIKGLEKKKK